MISEYNEQIRKRKAEASCYQGSTRQLKEELAGMKDEMAWFSAEQEMIKI